MVEPRYGAPLAQFANSMRDPDPDGARKAAAELWRRMGIVVIFPGDLKGLEGTIIEAAAFRKYGKREKT